MEKKQKQNNGIISEKEYKDALEIVLEKIIADLSKKKKVTLRNFGSFTIRKHKKRAGINPKTGEKITIPEKNVVKFNACKALKSKVK